MHIQGGANCDTLCNDTIVTISSHIYQKGPGTFWGTKVLTTWGDSASTGLPLLTLWAFQDNNRWGHFC